MARRIVVIDGHPDPDPKRYVHALADAYARGAAEAGHEVRRIDLAKLAFPLLATSEEFRNGTPPPSIRKSQESLAWAQHWVILYPLWLGSMPALLKGFFEQVGRPGFAFAAGRGRGLPKKLLAGRSARVVVTMGMPSLFYRWYYRAHSLKSLERNILAFIGVSPVRASIVGTVDALGAGARADVLARMRRLGARAE